MIRKIKLMMFFMLATLVVLADNVQFTMEGPDAVTIGDQFRLSFNLNQSGSDLQLPDLSNFDVLMGPSTSQSTSIQMINGKTTQSVNFSYTFVLRAKKEGKFNIRPASIKVDGKTYESNSITIQVVKGQSQGNQQNNQQQQQEAPTGNISKDNLFVAISVDKNNVSKGEQIISTVKLYVSQNVPLNGFEDIKIPTYEGFWTKEIEVPSQVNFTREVYNGKIYQVGILKKTVLFPQQTGSIRINPFEITCQVRQRIRQAQSFFDDFFDNYQIVKAKIVSDPVVINVKELPNPPSNFGGAVGNFSFSGSIDKTELKSNEAVTLKLIVTGSGNLSLINPPKVELPEDFESYEPKTSDRITATENGVSGSITFEYLFIPRFAGNFTIPAIKFTFFNPSTKQYETRSTDDFRLKIEKGNDETGSSTVSSFSKENIKMIGKDIRFIKQNKSKFKPKGSSFYGTFEFYLIYILSILAFIVFFVLNRKKIKENSNIALMKNKRANKIARKRLKEASIFLKNNRAEQFYESVIKALWGYLSDKLSIAVADLNREKASATLKEKGISVDVINDFLKTIDDCEFARYAPTTYSGTMDEIYNGAAGLIEMFEKQIK